MSTAQEIEWARTLRTARTKLGNNQPARTVADRIAVQKDIRAAKSALRLACKSGNEVDARGWLQSLIRLRADQTAIALADLSSVYGTVAPVTVERLCERYAKDCLLLTRSVHTLLSTHS